MRHSWLGLCLLLAILFPAAPQGQSDPEGTTWGWTGLREISDVTEFGAPVVCPFRPKERVARIVEVDPDSPAARAGIGRDEYLLRIEGRPAEVREMRRAVLRLAPGKSLRVTLLRAAGEVEVTLLGEPRSLRGLIADRVESAALWLCLRQDAAGGWPGAPSFGPPEANVAASALVALALATLPPGHSSPDARQRVGQAFDRGTAWLWATQHPDGGLDASGPRRHRVFATAFALLAFQARAPGVAEDRQRRLRDFLIASQVVEPLAEDPAGPLSIGGWNLEDGSESASAQVELAGTACALEALAATQHWHNPAVDRCFTLARGFVESCQNLPRPGRPGLPEWDDGGFHSAPGRSKAGEKEVELDLVRCRSYGSATADGLRALLYLGTPASDLRVVRAAAWLGVRFDVQRNPGFPERLPVPYDRALFFYYAASLAKALDRLGPPLVPAASPNAPARSWARELAIELLARQEFGGSWRNPIPLMAEDDPVVATSLALLALNTAWRTCR